MNKCPDNSIIVSYMAGDDIRIIVTSVDLKKKMNAMGFVLDGDRMKMKTKNTSEKVEAINSLILIGALFQCTSSWNPHELIEYYREQGFRIGNHKVIYWTDPQTYKIEER